MEENIIEKIKDILDAIRPYLQEDGGDVEFVSYEDHIVHVQLMGHCDGCPFAQMTIKNGIENVLREIIPEIEGVVADNMPDMSEAFDPSELEIF